MSKRNIGNEILLGIAEIKDFKADKKDLKTTMRSLKDILEQEKPEVVEQARQLSDGMLLEFNLAENNKVVS